ncbi:MAG: nitrous oxide reductase family maturation protein NosD [Promethearchaeota archaeon]
MMKRRRITLPILIMIMVLIINSGILHKTIDDKESSLRENKPALSIQGLSDYISMDPIKIFNNTAFKDNYGFAGEGTAEEPYLIEGISITSNTETLIHIENTTKHFHINGSFFNCLDGLYSEAVSFLNVTHGTFVNNTIIRSWFGVTLLNSSQIHIENNTINTTLSGIGIIGSDTTDNIIFNNTIQGSPIAIWASTMPNNNIIKHNSINSTQIGIFLDSSNHNTLLENTIRNCTLSGIFLAISNNNNLTRNTIYNTTGNGIGMLFSNDTTLTSNTIYNCTHGIYLNSSNVNDFSNNIIYNCSRGILLNKTNYNTLTGNTVHDCYEGIIKHNSSHNILTGNTIYNTTYGIELETSTSNTISANTVSNCTVAIVLNGDCYNNTMSGNPVNDCFESIYLYLSDNNTLTDCTINDCTTAIMVEDSDNNTISHNIIYNSSSEGITVFTNSNLNIFKGNTIYNCSTDGIYLAGSNNTISFNTIYNNTNYGLNLVDSENNTVIGNNFIDNGAPQAYDDGIRNNVSYNYWADWTSPDLVEPYGIVDNPYILAGSSGNMDPFPLTALPPLTIDILAPISQEYETEIISVILSGSPTITQTWYYIEGIDNQNRTWTTSEDRTLPDGPYTLHAYGSDITGHVVYSSVSFGIDAHLPSAVITNPINTTYSHIEIPLFYTVSHGIVTSIFLNGMINTTAVPSGSVVSDFPDVPVIPDGSYNITIVVVDHALNFDQDTIFFTIDMTPPTITIESPTATTYTTGTISVDLSSDDMVDSWWYSIDDGPNQSWTGSVTESLAEGTYTLHVYGNDSVGNIGYASVTLTIEIPGETSIPVSSSAPTSTSATIPTTAATPMLETTPETSITSSSEAASGTFPGIFSILVVFATLVVIIRRHKHL